MLSHVQEGRVTLSVSDTRAVTTVTGDGASSGCCRGPLGIPRGRREPPLSDSGSGGDGPHLAAFNINRVSLVPVSSGTVNLNFKLPRAY